jgi:kynurenine 3-monooxygenase
MPASKSKPLTLIGAGPVGSLLAIFLARRGYQVRIYERRPDMRKEKVSAGRSINLALSIRGLNALREIGLEAEVLAQSIPMKGRMIHTKNGELTFQRYGRNDSESINSVSRGDLNKLLMTTAEATGNVEIFFNQKATHADFEGGMLTVRDERTGLEKAIPSPCLIGTDGSASVVREEILKSTKSECNQDYLNYGYKELVLPSDPAGSFKIEKNALHIWPRGTFMLIALPNLDGSFTCTLFLPMEGPLSFASVTDKDELKKLFSEHFSDVVPLIPGLESEFFANPTGRMVTVKCEPWNVKDRALVLGDAAHAIVPFFGQGMNCGFEDCSVFDRMLEKGFSFEKVFHELSSSRKDNTDAIADMAVENFVEMRDKVGNAQFLMEKGVERILQEKFPDDYASRYALVTFGQGPYRQAYDAGLIQNEILKELCQGIQTPGEVDLALAEKLIRSKLKPLFKEI